MLLKWWRNFSLRLFLYYKMLLHEKFKFLFHFHPLLLFHCLLLTKGTCSAVSQEVKNCKSFANFRLIVNTFFCICEVFKLVDSWENAKREVGIHDECDYVRETSGKTRWMGFNCDVKKFKLGDLNSKVVRGSGVT